jgi:hypothetical protein
MYTIRVHRRGADAVRIIPWTKITRRRVCIMILPADSSLFMALQIHCMVIDCRIHCLVCSPRIRPSWNLTTGHTSAFPRVFKKDYLEIPFQVTLTYEAGTVEILSVENPGIPGMTIHPPTAQVDWSDTVKTTTSEGSILDSFRYMRLHRLRSRVRALAEEQSCYMYIHALSFGPHRVDNKPISILW